MESPNQGSTPIEIHALGGFKVLVDGKPLRFVFKAPRKPLDLLKGLLISSGSSVGQHTLCEALWPDLDAWYASRALNTAVFRLRGLLCNKAAVRSDCGQLLLDPEHCTVDAWQFERNLDNARDPDALLLALQGYRGAFLGDSEHPLALGTRRRLQRKYLRGVLHLGQAYELCGNYGSATDLYHRGLDAEGTSEELHSALIACLQRSGQTVAAAAAAAAAAYQRGSNAGLNSGGKLVLSRTLRSNR
jgi:two-component SAPR family response regulator